MTGGAGGVLGSEFRLIDFTPRKGTDGCCTSRNHAKMKTKIHFLFCFGGREAAPPPEQRYRPRPVRAGVPGPLSLAGSHRLASKPVPASTHIVRGGQRVRQEARELNPLHPVVHLHPASQVRARRPQVLAATCDRSPPQRIPED